MEIAVGKRGRWSAPALGGGGVLLAVALAPALTPASVATAAATAAAPTIVATKACFVNTTTLAPVTINGSGWTPGDSVQLASSDLYGTVPQVRPNGTFSQTISGAALNTTDPAAKTELLTATDQGNSTVGSTGTGQTATTSFQIANLAVATNPAQTKPSRKVSFSFSGFPPGASIFGHYVHGSQVAATQHFGRATGPCGLLKHRALLFPGGQPKYARYTVQFDGARRYSTASVPRLVTSIQLFRF